MFFFKGWCLGGPVPGTMCDSSMDSIDLTSKSIFIFQSLYLKRINGQLFCLFALISEHSVSTLIYPLPNHQSAKKNEREIGKKWSLIQCDWQLIWQSPMNVYWNKFWSAFPLKSKVFLMGPMCFILFIKNDDRRTFIIAGWAGQVMWPSPFYMYLVKVTLYWKNKDSAVWSFHP